MCNSEAHLRVNAARSAKAVSLSEMLTAWAQMKEKMQNGEISPEEYARWRDCYPKYDTTGHWHYITPIYSPISPQINPSNNKRLCRSSFTEVSRAFCSSYKAIFQHPQAIRAIRHIRIA